MNVIYSRELIYGNPIKLNKDGKTVGFPVTYKHNRYYLTCREYNLETEHFFRYFAGFGIQKSILKQIFKGEKHPFDKMIGIIIYYKGKREDRYYFADMDTWLMHSKDYETVKIKENVTESYGYQKVLAKDKMVVLGYSPRDYAVRKQILESCNI